MTVGDGDAFLEPGETARLAVPAINNGDGKATAVSVGVVSSDPLATITPATQSYGTVAAGATKTLPFTLKLAASYPRGKPVSLTVDGVLHRRCIADVDNGEHPGEPALGDRDDLRLRRARRSRSRTTTRPVRPWRSRCPASAMPRT